MKYIRKMFIVAGLIAATFSATLFISPQAYALRIPHPAGAAAVSLAAYLLCKKEGGTHGVCSRWALLADPPAPGVMELSLDIAYDSSMYAFNPLESGFLCQFSQDGDCPPTGSPAGTFPIALLPDSG